MYIYLPSCNFSAASPESSRKIRAYLARKPKVRVAGCCRKEQAAMQPEDVVISICLTCSAITREVSPQVTEMSFWEYVLTDPAFPWPDFHGERITLQDCWRARHLPVLHRAVRACLRRMNFQIVELDANKECAQFDGTWLFNRTGVERNRSIAPVFAAEAERCLTPLPEAEQRSRMEEHARQYATERIVAYCNACLAGIRLGTQSQKRGVHLMDLLTDKLV